MKNIEMALILNRKLTTKCGLKACVEKSKARTVGRFSHAMTQLIRRRNRSSSTYQHCNYHSVLPVAELPKCIA